jgi:quercetin dioxygenase-like cupin family protein
MTTTTEMKPAVITQSQGKQMPVLGHSVTVKLTKEQTNGEYYSFELISPPGAGVPPHVHENEDEIIEVIEGEFEVMLGDQKFNAPAGSTIFFPRFIPHAFQNIGAKAGKTIWTVVPSEGFEEFFSELSALSVGQPDMGKVVATFEKYGMKVLLPQ